MKSLDFGRVALSSCAAVAMLAGCGGSQPPIGAPGAMLQSRAIATRPERGGSWMLPEAKSEDLLYASDIRNSVVWVYAYPSGQQVGRLSGFPSQPAGLCSDSLGDVYVATSGVDVSSSNVYEYAHGGTNPINTLSDPGQAFGCAVDPTTGNLAVANPHSASVPNVAVYEGAKGMPSVYAAPENAPLAFCAYDDHGDLFVNGGLLAELPLGGGSLTEIQLPKSMNNTASIQWARDQLIMATINGSDRGPETLYRVVSVSGVAKVEGTVTLSSSGDKRAVGAVEYSIQSNRVIAPGLADGNNILLQLWKFPHGGLPIKIIRPPKKLRVFLGVTVSLAPR
jgi:hypothetical protein